MMDEETKPGFLAAQGEKVGLALSLAALAAYLTFGVALADGDEEGFHYYYDPAVRVRQRHEVATSYGASDPTEDFAEFAPIFYTDPPAAMQLSPEKFLYFNGMVGGHYDGDRLWAVAREAGLDASRLARAARAVQERVESSWTEARPRPGGFEPAD